MIIKFHKAYPEPLVSIAMNREIALLALATGSYAAIMRTKSATTLYTACASSTGGTGPSASAGPAAAPTPVAPNILPADATRRIGAAVVFSLPSGRTVRVIVEDQRRIVHLCWSPCGRLLTVSYSTTLPATTGSSSSGTVVRLITLAHIVDAESGAVIRGVVAPAVVASRGPSTEGTVAGPYDADLLAVLAESCASGALASLFSFPLTFCSIILPITTSGGTSSGDGSCSVAVDAAGWDALPCCNLLAEAGEADSPPCAQDADPNSPALLASTSPLDPSTNQRPAHRHTAIQQLRQSWRSARCPLLLLSTDASPEVLLIVGGIAHTATIALEGATFASSRSRSMPATANTMTRRVATVSCDGEHLIITRPGAANFVAAALPEKLRLQLRPAALEAAVVQALTTEYLATALGTLRSLCTAWEQKRLHLCRVLRFVPAGSPPPGLGTACSPAAAVPLSEAVLGLLLDTIGAFAVRPHYLDVCAYFTPKGHADTYADANRQHGDAADTGMALEAAAPIGDICAAADAADKHFAALVVAMRDAVAAPLDWALSIASRLDPTTSSGGGVSSAYQSTVAVPVVRDVLDTLLAVLPQQRDDLFLLCRLVLQTARSLRDERLPAAAAATVFASPMEPQEHAAAIDVLANLAETLSLCPATALITQMLRTSVDVGALLAHAQHNRHPAHGHVLGTDEPCRPGTDGTAVFTTPHLRSSASSGGPSSRLPGAALVVADPPLSAPNSASSSTVALISIDQQGMHVSTAPLHGLLTGTDDSSEDVLVEGSAEATSGPPAVQPGAWELACVDQQFILAAPLPPTDYAAFQQQPSHGRAHTGALRLAFLSQEEAAEEESSEGPSFGLDSGSGVGSGVIDIPGLPLAANRTALAPVTVSTNASRGITAVACGAHLVILDAFEDPPEADEDEAAAAEEGEDNDNPGN